MPLHLKIFNQVVEVIIIIIMKEFIVRLLQCGHKPITTCCSVLPPEIVMHNDAYIGGRSENNINVSCTTISGGRTKQLDTGYILLHHWLYK